MTVLTLLHNKYHMTGKQLLAIFVFATLGLFWAGVPEEMMRRWYILGQMAEERRVIDDLRHGYHWNEEKDVLARIQDYTLCSFLAHDSALFRLALTLQYDKVIDEVRASALLVADSSIICGFAGYELQAGTDKGTSWRMYLQRIVADSLAAGDVLALEALQRRGDIGDAFPYMPVSVLVRAPREARLAPWLKRYFQHYPLYDAMQKAATSFSSSAQPLAGPLPRKA